MLTDQVAFFGVRILNPTVKRYVTQELRKSYEKNEKGKKKQYNERILKIEHGTFTPLVMSTTGGMSRESRKSSAHFSEIISKKTKEIYAFIASRLRRKISFALPNSLSTCLSGIRSFYYTSNTYSENLLSSFTKVTEVTSNVDTALLSF